MYLSKEEGEATQNKRKIQLQKGKVGVNTKSGAILSDDNSMIPTIIKYGHWKSN